jgi:hypothetical protein
MLPFFRHWLLAGLLTFLRLGSPVFDVGGGTGFRFAPLVVCCICLRMVSGSGIPGVGVAPGFSGFPSVFGSGMPGVGVVPFATFALPGAGIPGVEFPVGTIGLAESPGGRLFASTACIVFRFALEFAVFEFVPASPPQAAARAVHAATADIKNLFINDSLKHLNIAVPARMLRPWRSATAFEPARAGIKRLSEGESGRHRQTAGKCRLYADASRCQSNFQHGEQLCVIHR